MSHARSTSKQQSLDGDAHAVANFTTHRGLAHSASLEELDDVEAFLREKLPASGDKAGASADGDGKSEL